MHLVHLSVMYAPFRVFRVRFADASCHDVFQTMGGKHSVWKDEKVTIPYHSVRRPRTSSSEGHSLLRRAERFWGPLLSEDPAARPTMETVIQMVDFPLHASRIDANVLALLDPA